MVERCSVPPDKIKVIHNGLAVKPTNIPRLYERSLNIVTVANLIPYKGHLEYLSAIKKVLQEIPDVHFTFIGRDDMNGKVQSAIIEWDLSENVTCVGFQEDISSWMKDARLLVLPSLKEGVPTTVLEAMSYGVPVIAYNVGGLPELIRHEQDGLLVPAKDTKCLAMSIIKLLKENDLANKLSISSLARIDTEFQLNTCVAKHQDALLSLVKGS